jgi:hypothetical protein
MININAKVTNFIEYHKDKIISVPIDKVLLQYKIHQSGTYTTHRSEKPDDELVIIAMPFNGKNGELGYYRLTIGWGAYWEAKHRGLTEIRCLPRYESREQLEKILFHKRTNQKSTPMLTVESLKKTTLFPLQEIVVPETFAKTPPNRAKVKLRLDYYEKHHALPQPIRISRKNNTLLDGYATYIAATELGLSEVPVLYGRKAR